MQRLTAVIVLCLLSFQTYGAPRSVAIASAHPLATEAGFEVVRKGGNVFDAAVAVAAALAVVEPTGSGLGGGGYWLLHRAQDGMEVMLDGREKAPKAAHEKMFQDEKGDAIPRLSLDGALAAGIPGLPATLVKVAEKFGKLPLSESLKPAIRYAETGFAISDKHLELVNYRIEVLKKYPQTAKIFLDKGEAPKLYSILRQSDLAETLKRLASSGRDGFYSGTTAEKLINAVQKAGGIWTKEDLADYQVLERKPITGEYRGIKISSSAPSSSGGIVLLEALNILSGFDLDKLDSITRKHLIAEAMRRAYHDRALYLGDSDFITIPVNLLLSKDYAAGQRSSIRPDKALPSAYLSGERNAQHEGDHTTHFSIIDSEGNRVAATLSINFPFGSGFVADGTGVLLNDEMDDFVSSKEANGYGLIGGAANAIAPGKRMLSSMAPTFVEDADRIGVLGTPGGSRITTMVLLGVLDFAAGRGPESWVKVPRFHHQFMPDVLQHENGALSETEIQGLSALGHQVKLAREHYGNMQAAMLDKRTKQLSAASDWRGEGRAVVMQFDMAEP